MDVSEILSTVQCTFCQSHVNVKRLSNHVCPLTQSHRFSRISYYNLGSDTAMNEKEYLTLPEIILKKRNSGSENPSTTCSRCHHHHATISFAQKLYHTGCLTCFVCRSPLVKTIKVFEGQIYCLEHYNLMKSKPACSMCHKVIESYVRPTIALGKVYHPEHIRCYQCNKPVDMDMTGLVERKGKIYCQTDFNNLFLPKCESCHCVVRKEAIISKDGKLKGIWHPHCFKCYLCNKTFPNNQFYVFNNAPYCKQDYHKLNKTLCIICFKPVEGTCGELVNGLKIHPQCFVCHVCQCNISDSYFVSGNHIYCQNHNRKN